MAGKTEHTQPNEPLVPLMSHADVANRLGIGKRTFQTWLTLGHFPPAEVRLRKTRRWRRETVEAWIEEQADRG